MGKSTNPSVFISSTYEDLASHRSAIWKVIVNSLPLEIRGMEQFGARSEKPIDVCLEEVSKSDIFVCIIGMCYGSIEETEGKSFVELEYNKANSIRKERDLPILIYIIDEKKGSIHPIDVDCENRRFLHLFKKRLTKNHNIKTFENEADLSFSVVKDLTRTLQEKRILPERESKVFITAALNSGVFAHGDRILIGGTATGTSKSIGLWIFHDNFFLHQYIFVRADNSYVHAIPLEDIFSMPTGQYYVLLQHPGDNNIFDVLPVHELDSIQVVSIGSETFFKVAGEGSLKGVDAASALVNLLNNAMVDDVYTKLSFFIEEPWIHIDKIGDITKGDIFKITGTTNLAIGDKLIAEISPLFSQDELKLIQNETSKIIGFGVIIGSVTIVGGINYNQWSFDVDTSPMNEGKYSFNMHSIRQGGKEIIAQIDFLIKGK